MPENLAGTTVLIVGGTSGIGRAIASEVAAIGGSPVLAGRNTQRLSLAASQLSQQTGAEVGVLELDLSDEDSIVAAAKQLSRVDHVISLAADHANGPVAELEVAAVQQAFGAKVLGPILLAKHLAPKLQPGGSFLFFSGFVAWRPTAGLSVMATTNGAVSFLASALAVDLAPARVNALSPGIVDSGVWDGMGAEQRDAMFAETAAKNPVSRVGTTDDIARAAVSVLTNGFITGTTLHVDGGGRIA